MPRLRPVFLLLFLAAAAGRAQEVDEPDSLRPTLVFASIERAWVVGDAQAVVQQFGKRKVYISLPDGGPAGGHFSRDQSFFIFKDFFDATRTEEFSFVTIRPADEQRSTAIGLADRTFRRRDSSRTQQDRIFVSLVFEDSRWVVSEIKSVR
jgi:hypothetical protein